MEIKTRDLGKSNFIWNMEMWWTYRVGRIEYQILCTFLECW